MSHSNGRVQAGDPRESAEQADDAWLVERAQANPDAFGELYDRYVEPIYWFCYRRLGGVQAAEDATSAIFVKALAGLPRFDPKGGGFRSWLFTIAHNVVLDAVRQAARRPDKSLDLVAELTDNSPRPKRPPSQGMLRRRCRRRWRG